MANNLSLEKKAQIVQMLAEGSSMRSISRITGASINTVTTLLEKVGYACQAYHNEKVVGLKSKRVQADEIWAFCYMKQKNVREGMVGPYGDVWTWTAIDADSKLMITWLSGDRDKDSAEEFISDLKDRLSNRVQLTTDSLGAYKGAVKKAFDENTPVDYAQVHKTYQSSQTETRYSPAVCTGMEIRNISGNPSPIYASTSYVERQNLNIRMHMRRFTRLTNGFSKKIANHCHALALYFVYYNFCKVHTTLGVTPAMEAGIMSRKMDVSEMVKLTEIYKENLN